MFLSNDKIEKNSLRQGDIVTKIHLLGAININGIHYSSPAGKPHELASWNVPSVPKIGDAMVLSHSCEIALENDIKITSIILAPLRDIHKATAKDRIDELIRSNLIDRSNPSATFLKYFYIPPYPDLEYTQGAIVDFSKLFSVRNNCYKTILDKKIAQLSEEVSSSMALKLALYFHRRGSFAA